MVTSQQSKFTFPLEFRLKGGTFIFRPLTSACQNAMLDFARGLPQEDLLFLDRDITQDAVVEKWIEDATGGELATAVAWQGDAIAGYATMYRGRARWTQHVAELRVVVAESARGAGLGRALLELIFEIALERGVRKLVARMTPDESAAMRLFQNLGFETEATLNDHAMDANGLSHDLLILSYHASQDDRNLCGACGVPILSALSLEGVRLCAQCFESRYEELGGGD